MTNVVVIGGTGLIGSKVVTRLAEHGHEAIAFFTTSTGNLLAAEKTANAVLEVAALRPQNALQVRKD